MFKNARAYIQTLGCPKNEVDSEIIRGSLESEGFRLCSDPEEADIVIVNSCGFIQEAKEESIQTTLSLAAMKNENKSRKLILYGCLGQRYRRELKKLLPEVDAIFGVEEIDSLVNYCRDEETLVAEGEKSFAPRYVEYSQRKIATDRPHAFLKISEGCDNHCSYCAIPGIRGPLRSRLIENVIKEAQTLVDSGVKEIILIAQDTTSYGVDIYGSPELVRLLREISRIENLEWIRILYAQPRGVDEKLIREISENEKICKYIDLPLQHISDKILRRMNRKVTKKQICDLIERVRIAVPGVALRTTLMVGFPGETEADFQELLDFVEETRFDQLGAFAYSREEGTEAYDFSNQVPRRIREERLDLLMSCQRDIIFERNERRIGDQLEVLVGGKEEGSTGRWVCRSEHQAPEIDNCFLTTGLNLKAGDFVRVKVVGQEVYDLVAELEEPRRFGSLTSGALRTSG
ncbi:MAG: 30S ribosomal protein S12 methylthiotransferase RimO [Candidatus Zixiibacteriota bacterium]